MTNELTAAQRRAAATLAAGRKVAEAATAAGVSEASIFRWQKLPEFRQAIAAAQAELLESAAGKLASAQDAAVYTIASIMADKAEPASIRLRAAIAIIDALLQLRSAVVMERRIERLEELADASTD